MLVAAETLAIRGKVVAPIMAASATASLAVEVRQEVLVVRRNAGARARAARRIQTPSVGWRCVGIYINFGGGGRGCRCRRQEQHRGQKQKKLHDDGCTWWDVGGWTLFVRNKKQGCYVRGWFAYGGVVWTNGDEQAAGRCLVCLFN